MKTGRQEGEEARKRGDEKIIIILGGFYLFFS